MKPKYLQAMDLKMAGKSNAEIAEEMGCSRRLVKNYLNYERYSMRKTAPEEHNMYLKVAEKIKDGKTTAEAADELGIDVERARGLRAYAVRRKVIEADRGNRSKRPDVVRMVKSGLSVTEIANALNCCTRNVYRQIARARNLGELPEEEKTRTRPRSGNLEKEFRSMSKEARAFVLGEMQPGDTIASAMKEIVLDVFFERAAK